MQTVRNVLSGVQDDGLDPEGVRLLLEMIAGTGKPPKTPVSTASVLITRAECVEPGCQWENSPMCRFTGEHRHKLRTYALVEDEDE